MIDDRRALQTDTRRRIDRPSTWVRVESEAEPAAESARRLVAWSVATAALSLAIAAWLLQLWRADLKVPFSYGGDALLHQLYIKATLEHGWYLHNEALAAPFGQDLHDFPLVDSLHFVLIKIAALVTGGGFGRATNGYFLMTFPLVSVSALLAMRRLGVGFGPAAVAAQLFAFLPYHFLRGEGHLFLSGYFLIPPTTLLALGIYLDPGTLPGSSERRRFGVSGLLTCLLVGSSGAYYAYFSCYLLAISGLAGALRSRSAAPLRAAGFGVAVIVAGALANLAPKFAYDWEHGPNRAAVHRSALEAEVHGLRLVQLLTPIANHRLEPVARLLERWGATMPGLGWSYYFSTLGLTASLGFLLLLGRSLRGIGSARPEVADGLALLNIFVLILAMSGGFGAVLGVVVSPWVRAYERFSIFIAFFALTTLALAVSRPRPSSRLGRALGVAALGVVLALGVLDQTNASFIPDYESAKKSFDSDLDLVRRIEATLPSGAMVFEMPSIAFPEVVNVEAMSCYDPLRPYLHSKRLRWSHGALKGSEPDRWREHVAGLPLEEKVRVLTFAGFEGLFVDRGGFGLPWPEVEATLGRVVGSSPMVSRDQRFSFFPLTAYRARLRGSMTESDWLSARDLAFHPAVISWGAGFDAELAGPDGPYRWCSGSGELILTNPGDSPHPVVLSMRCIPGAGQPCELRVDSPLWTERFASPPEGVRLRHTLILPPGESRFTFSCDGPPVPSPTPRRLVFLVQNTTLQPVSQADGPASGAEPGRRPSESSESTENPAVSGPRP